MTISWRKANRQYEGRFPCCFSVYNFEGWAVEEWPCLFLPLGITIFNYIQQMAFGRKDVKSLWFGCLVETGALTHKPKENLLVREIRLRREATESGKCIWWHLEKTVWTDSEQSKTGRSQTRREAFHSTKNSNEQHCASVTKGVLWCIYPPQCWVCLLYVYK